MGIMHAISITIPAILVNRQILKFVNREPSEPGNTLNLSERVAINS